VTRVLRVWCGIEFVGPTMEEPPHVVDFGRFDGEFVIVEPVDNHPGAAHVGGAGDERLGAGCENRRWRLGPTAGRREGDRDSGDTGRVGVARDCQHGEPQQGRCQAAATVRPSSWQGGPAMASGWTIGSRARDG